jgi:malate dehydrogenase
VGGNLAFRIAMGDMFSVNQPVILQLDSRDLKALEGLRMELEDTCATLLACVVIGDKYEVAFGDADYACLVGSPPSGKGMERGDLLKKLESFSSKRDTFSERLLVRIAKWWKWVIPLTPMPSLPLETLGELRQKISLP